MMSQLSIKRTPGAGTITIENPLAEHEGVYQCFASNRYGIALSVKTLLKQAELLAFPPVLNPQIHRPLIGSYLKLQCNPPMSYPTGITNWGESKPGSKFKAIEVNKRIALDYSGNLHIANIETGDSREGKKYICIVQNQVLRGLVEGNDQLIQPIRNQNTINRIRPKLEWNSETPTIAVLDTVKKLKCIFSGYPTPDITWSMADGSPLPKKVIVGETGHELKIPDVAYGDEGYYKCTASNSKADSPASLPSKTIQLTVESVPLWVNEPESVDTSEEEDAKFHCQAGGKPPPSISWAINGQDVNSIPNPRRQILNNGQVVKYTNVTKTDTAVLQCNATNPHGYIFLNAYLNVLAEPPTFISKPVPQVKVAEGQDTNLTCEVWGAPKPRVIWTKNDKVVEGNRFSVDTKGKIVGNLTILSATMEDAGLYTCTAENKFGKLAAKGDLIVRQKTEIVTTPKAQTVVAGEDVTLDCEATTDPAEESKLTITWQKNKVDIDFDKEDSLILHSNNSLTIKAAAVDDTSKYTCVADNGIDRDEYSAEVTVKDKPDPPKDVAVETCGAQSAEISWAPGNENNDAVTDFYVYYNTSFERDVFYEAAKVPKSDTRARIKLSPWTNYTFHATAENSIGMSERSAFAWRTCLTGPDIPYKNPEGVCTESRSPDQLVIVWKEMPQIDHNGEQFHYIVTYERLDVSSPVPISLQVDNWKQTELIVDNQDTFRKYKISVQAENAMGPSPPGSLQEKYGYSGEKEPELKPTGFATVDGTLNASSVEFMWDAVNEDDPLIHGFFKGYRIQYWKAGNSDDKRETDFILNQFDPCPLVENLGRRKKRQAGAGTEMGEVHDLWPYSQIEAGIMVLNGGKTGVMSDTISFKTPEGLPSAVADAKVAETGSYHVKLEWMPPLEPNGVIGGYTIGYKEAGTLQKEKLVYVGPVLDAKIMDLNPDTQYAFHVYAHSGAGMGDPYVIPATTLGEMPPDKPGFGKLENGEDWVNATIEPVNDAGRDGQENPGSEFYIKYKKEGEDQWVTTPVENTTNWINVTGLENGAKYTFVLVAKNKKGETESDPIVVIAGEPEKGGPAVDTVTQPIATAGWFIGILCAIIFLLLIVLILCLIRRNRGGKYPVSEKEKLRGRNPDDEEENFGEYNNKQPYMPLDSKGDEPQYNSKPPANMEDDMKPLDGSSESDSMAEYEDTDPSKFNEDGSFIGQYGGGKRDSRVQPDQQNALTTFV